MSQVSMYELEDIIDYSERKSDRVDRRSAGVEDVCPAQDDFVLRQVSAVTKTANVTILKEAIPEGENTTFQILNEGKLPMLEKKSSYYNNQEFPDSKGPDTCFKDSILEPVDKDLSEDEILGSRDAGTNRSLYTFPFTDMYQATEDLNIFGNKHENQECSFLSYDEWPDTSYIEDLDGLFGQNYSFGKENFANDHEIPWLSRSSHAIDGSNDASEQGLKSFFSDPGSNERPLKDHESDECHVPCDGIPDYDEKNVSSSYSSMDHSLHGSGLNSNSESMSEYVSEKENDTSRREQIKKRKQTEPKINDRKLESSIRSSFIIPSTTSQQLANPTKMLSDSSPNCIVLPLEKNIEKLYWKHNMEVVMPNRFQRKDSASHVAFTDQAHIGKKMRQNQDGVDYHCEVENEGMELPDLDMDPSVLFESSGAHNLGSDKFSVEETKFLQLQYVMGQLDVRTKLCIRDSLYRLARSAEQRNKMEQSGGSSRHGCGGIRHAEANNCTAFMDVETDTNPIDRSIAHLLFDRPAEGISFESNVSANFTHLFDQEIVF